MIIRYSIFLILVICVNSTWCWDAEEMELFDVVEEVNENFYDVMGLSQTAELSEVKKAYRTLSKQLHPDKNDADDAEVKFRQLVSIYEILRDDNMRARYDRVLVEGLPDWRSPIYYYRRARKMSLFEIAIILTVVISITQYLMAWGAYIDDKHTLEELLLKKYKIKDKKKKKEDLNNLSLIEETLENIPKPSWWNVLPIQFGRLIIFIFMNGPTMVRSAVHMVKEEKLRREEEVRKKEKEELKELQRQEQEEQRKEKKAHQKPRKRVLNVPDYSDGGCVLDSVDGPEDNDDQPAVKPVIAPPTVITGGPWTDEEFSELSRLMAKYPGGTKERWEKIAEQMNRTVFEVTKMSNKVKAQLGERHAVQEILEEVPLKVKAKTRGGKEGEKTDLTAGADEFWSLIQQRALEKALKLYPKGTDQRWEKICKNVPDKNKDECIIRFKFLAEKIRKKKEEQKLEQEGELEETTEVLCEDNTQNNCEFSIKTDSVTCVENGVDIE